MESTVDKFDKACDSMGSAYKKQPGCDKRARDGLNEAVNYSKPIIARNQTCGLEEAKKGWNSIAEMTKPKNMYNIVHKKEPKKIVPGKIDKVMHKISDNKTKLKYAE